MECFPKIVNSWFAKHSILDIRQGSEYAAVIHYVSHLVAFDSENQLQTEAATGGVL